MAGLTPKQRILLDEILGRDEDVKIIPWPKRPGVKIGLRLLSDGEMSEADAAARQWASEQGLDVGLNRHRDNEFASRYSAEVLLRALVSPDEGHQQVVPDADTLRKRLSRLEINLLIGAYNDFSRDMLADPDALSDEQLADLLETLRGPFDRAEAALLRLAPVTLRRLLRFTVGRLPESTGSAS
jgi:hypothetical protein